MATLYVRDFPDDIYHRLTVEAQTRRQSVSALTKTLIEAALDRADRERKTKENRGIRYREVGPSHA